MGNLLKRKYEHDTKEEMAAESSTQARPEDSLGLPSHGIFDDLKSLADQLDKLEEGVARIKRSVDELNSRLDPMAPQMQRPDMDYTVDDFNGSEITALLSPSYEYTSHGEEDMWEGSEMVRSGGTCSDDAPFTILDEPTKELYRRFWDEMAPPRAMELYQADGEVAFLRTFDAYAVKDLLNDPFVVEGERAWNAMFLDYMRVDVDEMPVDGS